MHNPAPGAVHGALRWAKANTDPHPERPLRRGVRGDIDDSERVEKKRSLEQVLEVVGSLDILELCGHV